MEDDSVIMESEINVVNFDDESPKNLQVSNMG